MMMTTRSLGFLAMILTAPAALAARPGTGARSRRAATTGIERARATFARENTRQAMMDRKARRVATGRELIIAFGKRKGLKPDDVVQLGHGKHARVVLKVAAEKDSLLLTTVSARTGKAETIKLGPSDRIILRGKAADRPVNRSIPEPRGVLSPGPATARPSRLRQVLRHPLRTVGRGFRAAFEMALYRNSPGYRDPKYLNIPAGQNTATE